MSPRDEIVDALARFAAATDARDWSAIRDLLTPDAVAYHRTGPDAIVAVMSEHLGGCGPTQHLLGNHRVSIDGDRAQSLSYARVYHVGAGPMVGSFFECMGEYDDAWVRAGCQWRLAGRTFETRIRLGDFAVLRPADPD
ncbi:MAG: nuclear transport factor 2 family protein [Nocardioides sp.]|uniref:nuclear transport factor 2 family protein n=1 Tax=Nocardioides sp. TaxID=35761 RepID=UPI003D6BD3BA